MEARIIVDLPSAETDRRKRPIEWLRSLFGTQLDLRSGREELTVGALWLLEGLVEAFASAGVHDVTTFRVDEEVVFFDTEDVPGDLPRIVRAGEAAGLLDRKFGEMHLLLAHRSPALHTTIDCKVKDGVLLGEAEMSIELSARGRAFAAGGDDLEPLRRELAELADRIAAELTRVLTGARVTRDPA